MTRYLLSIYQPEGDPPPPEVLDRSCGDLDAARTRRCKRRRRVGVRRRPARAEHGDRAAPAATATCSSTDGPFAEGKEHLGGFTIIEAPDLDAALEWGRKAARARPRCRSRSARCIRHLTDARSPRPTSSGSSPRSTGGRSRCWSASSATSTSPRTRSRTRSPRAVQRWPDDRAAAEPGGLDHHDRAQPGDRPPAPRGLARGPARAGGAAARAGDEPDEEGAVRDDRLRLIFTCCHPALATGARRSR